MADNPIRPTLTELPGGTQWPESSTFYDPLTNPAGSESYGEMVTKAPRGLTVSKLDVAATGNGKDRLPATPGYGDSHTGD